MEYLALIELLVIGAFVLGWGFLELYTLRLDRKRREAEERESARNRP